MKGSLDPTPVREGVKALGVALRAEQLDGCRNAAHDGGLDAFLFEWASQYPAAAQHADVTRLLSGLRGYYSWDHDQRDSQLGNAIVALRQLYVALGQAPVNPPVVALAEPAPKTKKKPTATTATTTSTPKAKVTADTANSNAPITLDSALEALPGVGKVNAAYATAQALREHAPQQVINFGSAGRVAPCPPGCRDWSRARPNGRRTG